MSGEGSDRGRDRGRDRLVRERLAIGEENWQTSEQYWSMGNIRSDGYHF